MKILTVPGIHDDGNASIDLIGRELRSLGYAWEEVNFPKRWAVQCYADSVQAEDCRTLLEAFHGGDCALGHSRAALVIFKAMELGARFDTVILFAPAAPADYRIPFDGCKRLVVIYNPRDKALLASRFLPYHPFTGRRAFALWRNSLGAVGYQGPPDTRVINEEAQPEKREWLDHSNFKLIYARWVQRCAAWLPAA